MTAAGMVAHDGAFVFRQPVGLVEDFDGNEGLADVMQQCRTRKPALVVLAHAEMLGERNRKAGHEQAVAVACRMMAADGSQPFAQGGMLDRLEDPGLGL